jgi:hypothetical protein
VAVQDGAQEKAALVGMSYVKHLEARESLRRRLVQGAGRDSSYDAMSAALALSSGATKADLPTFHLLALHGGERIAQEAFMVILRLEGPKAMTDWVARRYRGVPPRDAWSYCVRLEDDFRRHGR